MDSQFLLFVDAQSPLVPPRFPVELQDMVIHSLDGPWPDTVALARCALTCRHWHAVVVKILYDRIQIFGRRDYKLLERTLKGNHSLGHRVQLLGIHDVTPTERASLAYLHSPQSSMKLCIKELLISGPHGSNDSTFPFRRALLADLPHFKSVRHLQLYNVEFRSLDDVRRILSALTGLDSVVLRNVSWKGPAADFKPLFDTTSWQLSRISLSHCSSNFVAPFFWAMPPVMNETTRRKCGDDRARPALCKLDVTPIVELASFWLESPNDVVASPNDVVESPNDAVESPNDAVASLNDAVESICWEWTIADKQTGLWSLECCIDEIDSLRNSTYICFQLSSHTSISLHEFPRVVGIHLSKKKQDEAIMDRLDTLLCEFEALERLHINFLEPSTDCSLDSVIQKLPRWQKKLADQTLPPLQGLSMALSHDVPRPCCVETKNHRAYSRALILHSLYRVKDDLLTKGLKEQSIRAWEGILMAQKELVFVNPTEHWPSLHDTLDRMADANQDFGNTDEALEYAWEAVVAWRQLDKIDRLAHRLHGIGDLKKVMRLTAEGGNFAEGRNYRRALVKTWERRDARRDFEKDGYKFSEVLDHMAFLLQDIISEHVEDIGALRKLTAQDPNKYANPLTLALRKKADLHLQRHDSASAIRCRLEAVDVWRNLATRDPDEYTHRLARALEEMGDWASQNQLYPEAFDYHREAANIWRKVIVRTAQIS